MRKGSHRAPLCGETAPHNNFCPKTHNMRNKHKSLETHIDIVKLASKS